MAEKPNILVDIVGEHTIVKDEAAQDKYCEDNHPRANQKKESKTDLVKQDLEDRSYKT
jgi:hypothetical protein